MAGYSLANPQLWPKRLAQRTWKNTFQVYPKWALYVYYFFFCALAACRLTRIQAIHGQVGLLLTSTKPTEVIEWFRTYSTPDFPRSPALSPITLTLAPGPVEQRHSVPPEPFPHSSEPELRKLGLNTKLVRGVPTLDSSQTICKEGVALTAEQAQLIKLIGVKCVEFRVVLKGRWEKESKACVWEGGQKPSKRHAKVVQSKPQEDEEMASPDGE